MNILEAIKKVEALKIDADSREKAIAALAERINAGLTIEEIDIFNAVGGLENMAPKSDPPKKQGSDYVSRYQENLEKQRAFRNDQRVPPMIRDRMKV